MKNEDFTYKRKIVEVNSSLGTLSLRYISIKDSDKFIRDYEENLDEKSFAKQFIFNQTVSPEITLRDLDRIPDELSDIIKEYLTKEGLDYYFDLERFTLFDFKEDLYQFLSDYYRPNKHVLKLVDKKMDELTPIFEKINSMVPQLPNYYRTSHQKTFQNLSETSLDILETFNKTKPLNSIPEISSMATDFINTMQPQIEQFSDLIDRNLDLISIQNRINEALKVSEEHFKKPILNALDCLNKYSWFITLNMDYSFTFEVLSICDDDSSHKQSRINKLFVSYFLDDNCRELTNLLRIWEKNPLFKKRMKIFKDCVDTIKNSKPTTNFSNLVVPTLIAQIDGIQRDFMEKNNLKVDRGRVKYLDESKYKSGDVRWHEYMSDLTNSDEILDAMNDIFLNVLFQKTRPGEDYKTSIHFSRHKILHGENVRYGRKDYTIRCFLILDFLYEVSLDN